MNITTKKTIEKCPFVSFIPEPPKDPNKATFYVISIIEKGEGDLVFYSRDDTKSTTIHLTENSCFITPPFVTTQHINFKKKLFIQRNIHVDEATFKECCNLVNSDLYGQTIFKDTPITFKLTSPAAIYIAECCSLISGEEEKYFANIHRSLVCSILSSYLSSMMQNQAFPVWIKILLRNLNDLKFLLQPITEMVKTTHYSHGYVNREFKKILGMPLKQYVLNKKLDMAVSMLITTDLSMQDIVDRLNFSNVSNFINIFKATYKITPAKYRKINSKGISLDDYQAWGVSVLQDGPNRRV